MHLQKSSKRPKARDTGCGSGKAIFSSGTSIYNSGSPLKSIKQNWKKLIVVARAQWYFPCPDVGGAGDQQGYRRPQDPGASGIREAISPVPQVPRGQIPQGLNKAVGRQDLGLVGWPPPALDPTPQPGPQTPGPLMLGTPAPASVLPRPPSQES